MYEQVLDREILDMVDNKLYICWICLVQATAQQSLTLCLTVGTVG